MRFSLKALRRQCLHTLRQLERFSRAASDPRSLVQHEESVFSQNGEDGVLREILRRLNIREPFAVELGASDGVENCTRYLLESGARCVWIEGNPSKADGARQQFSDFQVEIVEEFITQENILDVLHSFVGVEMDPDVLVIDVDGNDWWLWRRIAQSFRPAVVVTEINSSLGMEQSWVMPYKPNHQWQGDQFYGASLRAYHQLARSIGYVLVGCESSGTNAFWIRKDLANDFWSLKPRDAFIPPSLENSHIYRVSELNGLDEFDLEDLGLEDVVVLESDESPWTVGGGLVVNRGKTTIHSFGPWPLRLGFGGESTQEPWRAWLRSPIRGGASGVAIGHRYGAKKPTWASLVEEGRTWGPRFLI